MPVLIADRNISSPFNVDTLTQENAKDIINRVRTHIDKPGKIHGVFVLVHRGKNGEQVELQRKNRIQLFCQWLFNNRGYGRQLKETHDFWTMILSRAGMNEAAEDLKKYLANKQPGYRDRVEVSYIRNLLEQHLQVAPTRSPAASSAESLEISASQPALVAAPSPEQTAACSTILGTRGYIAEAPSVDKLLANVGFRCSRAMPGEGKLSGISEIQFKNDPKVRLLTKFTNPSRIHVQRTDEMSEAFSAHLTSEKFPGCVAEAGVVQPEYYIVAAKSSYKMVDALGLRELIKASGNDTILCHGLISPKAEGEMLLRLLGRRNFDLEHHKKLIRGLLVTLKNLNQRGLIHRGLRPENICYDTASGKVTLIDAGTLSKASISGMETGMIRCEDIGDRRYMHPRAISGVAHGAEADVYALAMLTLRIRNKLAMEKLWSDPRSELHKSINDLSPGSVAKKFDNSFFRECLNRLVNKSTNDFILRESMEALGSDPLLEFAMRCLDLSSKPVGDWAMSAQAQEMYSELIRHRGLSCAE